MNRISVRIDSELKKKMESYRYLNWSEILRQTIITTIEKEQENNRAKAALLNEQIRKKSTQKPNSTEIIRKFREERYGSKLE